MDLSLPAVSRADRFQVSGSRLKVPGFEVPYDYEALVPLQAPNIKL